MTFTYWSAYFLRREIFNRLISRSNSQISDFNAIDMGMLHKGNKERVVTFIKD